MTILRCLATYASLQNNCGKNDEIMQYIDDNEFDIIEDRDIVTSQGGLIVIYDLLFDEDED